VHLAYIWIVCHLSAKNYQNQWKFDTVLTKTNLLSFFGTRCTCPVFVDKIRSLSCFTVCSCRLARQQITSKYNEAKFITVLENGLALLLLVEMLTSVRRRLSSLSQLTIR